MLTGIRKACAGHVFWLTTVDDITMVDLLWVAALASLRSASNLMPFLSRSCLTAVMESGLFIASLARAAAILLGMALMHTMGFEEGYMYCLQSATASKSSLANE